ncbi:MAG: AAA family ATPase, partial [Pseudomonadota bacterium]
MQFTKLRLQGFKSFVDPTDLMISTGLTGVVGPNGCGKSNLLEALRWAMGENRAKSMRGDGMEDVIFAGAESRPARNTASVDIVIDNSDRLAPAAFNDSDQLEVSRRITRDIGSAYTLNGKNVRARDVQMLFADASTGAHSPALVRQGQIVELISAKPKARRRILEEAAGISGLYQRRHEAELKLNGAETNLARVEDVLDGLDTQLKTLERQAAQARRYREIAEDLRRSEAALLFLRWKAAKDGVLALETAFSDAVAEAAKAEGVVLRGAEARQAAEEALPPLREEEMIAAAAHQRLVIEGEQLEEAEVRARREVDALHARIRQMRLDMDREITLNGDADNSIAQLEIEEEELHQAHEDQPEAIAAAQERAKTAGDTLSDQETELDRLTESAARLAARTASAERRKDEAKATIERIERDVAAAEDAVAALSEQIANVEHSVSEATTTEARCKAGAEEAEAALTSAETTRSEAQATEAEARALLSEAEGRVGAIKAEVDALDKLLKRDAPETAQLIDAVEVDPGYEAALGAALGDDLRFGEASDGTGWVLLDDFDSGALGSSLSDHVKAPRVLARRLERIGLVGTRAEGDARQSALAAGERLVSTDGDLWRWDGYRMRAEDSSSGAAHRLRQRNQLVVQRSALEDASSLRAKAAGNHSAGRDALEKATAQERACRDDRRIADQAFAEAARQLTRLEGELELSRGRRESQAASVESRKEEHEAATAAFDEARTALDDLDDVDDARRAVEVQRGEVDLARTAMLSARAASDDLRRQGLAREKRLNEISREKHGWQDRRDNATTRIA